VVVAAVPWARHDSSFTRSFEDQVAWLTVHTSKTAVSDLMRIACDRSAGSASASPPKRKSSLARSAFRPRADRV